MLRGKSPARVYIVGGGTAVHSGWRTSTIDADLFSADEAVFEDVQGIKERLELNIEFARPEDFVPALEGTPERHLFISTIGKISFFHYDPYAQLFSKVVRGFRQDLSDAEHFLSSGMVDPVSGGSRGRIPCGACIRSVSWSRSGPSAAPRGTGSSSRPGPA